MGRRSRSEGGSGRGEAAEEWAFWTCSEFYLPQSNEPWGQVSIWQLVLAARGQASCIGEGGTGLGDPHPQAEGLTGTVPETPRVPTAAQLPPLTPQDCQRRLVF